MRDIIAADDLDLEADPVVVRVFHIICSIMLITAKVHRARMEQHEMRSGKPLDPALKNVTFTQALADLSTRAEYIRRKFQRIVESSIDLKKHG